jgi:hypothetical protein
MEDLTLPSVGGKLEKMGGLCTHSPKIFGPFPKLPKKKGKKKRKKEKGQADLVQASTLGWQATAGRRPALGQRLGVGDQWFGSNCGRAT